MNARRLLHDLQVLGFVLTTNGEELRLNAPTGLLTLEQINTIKQAKPALIQLILPPEDQYALTRHCKTLGVELLPDDARDLLKLLPYHSKQRRHSLNQYLSIWQRAAEREPIEHKKQNAGRYAANSWLRNDLRA